MTSTAGSLIGWSAFCGVLLLTGVAFGLARWGDRRFSRRTRRLNERLEAGRLAPEVTRYRATELSGLPVPVQRYLRLALKADQPIIASVSVIHVGMFNMSQAVERWRPFTSIQNVMTRAPGFVWSGRISLFPGAVAFVTDAYVGGRGILRPTLLGLVSLGRNRSSDALDRAEMMRYLAEAAWYPTALLPSQGVTWVAIDESSADATIHDGHHAVTMLFRFDEFGMIESVSSEERPATEGSRMVMRPWRGCWTNYQKREGMRIPLNGEASWVCQGRKIPYWHGAIASVQYQFCDGHDAAVM
jgi:hypothetical protein